MSGYESVGRYLVKNGPVYFKNSSGQEEMGNIVAKSGNSAKVQSSNGKTTIVNYQTLYTYTNPDYDQEISDFGLMGGRKKTKKNKKLKRKTMRRKH